MTTKRKVPAKRDILESRSVKRAEEIVSQDENIPPIIIAALIVLLSSGNAFTTIADVIVSSFASLVTNADSERNFVVLSDPVALSKTWAGFLFCTK